MKKLSKTQVVDALDLTLAKGPGSRSKWYRLKQAAKELRAGEGLLLDRAPGGEPFTENLVCSVRKCLDATMGSTGRFSLRRTKSQGLLVIRNDSRTRGAV